MIVIQVLGVSDATTEEQLQTITEDLHKLCSAAGDDKYWIGFSRDCMQMDLGKEFVALISGISAEHKMSATSFADRVGDVLEKHFPDAAIGHQLIQAITTRELRKKS